MNISAILAKKFPSSTGIVCEGDTIIQWDVPEHPDLPTADEIALWRNEVDFIEITATQFLRALTAAGYRNAVDNYVAASTDQDLKDLYNRSQTFRSNHPLIISSGEALGLSRADIDAVFTTGAALE